MPFNTFNLQNRWVVATRYRPYVAGTNNRILVAFNVEGFTPLQISARCPSSTYSVTPYIFLWTGDVNNGYFVQREIVAQGPTQAGSGQAFTTARTGSFQRSITLVPGVAYINIELCTIASNVPYEVAPTWTARNLVITTLKK